MSKIAPRGDADVSPLNDIIERLCNHYSAELIDIFRAFHDTDGLLCMRYMSQHDTIHPSTSGLKRILGTINKTVEVVYNFDNIVFTPIAERNQFGNRARGSHKRHLVTVGNIGQSSRHCLKCGETNHDTVMCRHRLPITCWSCGHVGHKQEQGWIFE